MKISDKEAASRDVEKWIDLFMESYREAKQDLENHELEGEELAKSLSNFLQKTVDQLEDAIADYEAESIVELAIGAPTYKRSEKTFIRINND